MITSFFHNTNTDPTSQEEEKLAYVQTCLLLKPTNISERLQNGTLYRRKMSMVKKTFFVNYWPIKIIIFHNGLKISFTKNKWSFKLKFTTFFWGKQFNQQKRQRGSMKNAGKKRLLKKRHITIIVFCFCFCFLLLFSFLSCGCYFQSSSSSSSDSASSSQVSHWLT